MLVWIGVGEPAFDGEEGEGSVLYMLSMPYVGVDTCILYLPISVSSELGIMALLVEY